MPKAVEEDCCRGGVAAGLGSGHRRQVAYRIIGAVQAAAARLRPQSKDQLELEALNKYTRKEVCQLVGLIIPISFMGRKFILLIVMVN